MKSASAGEHQLTPDGTAFHMAGSRGARPLVLIHGLGLCRRLWDPFLAGLGGSRLVVAYDLPGHGDSAPLKGEASLALYARQIRDLMDHCGIASADLVGFSIGGMINRRCAMDFPERCRSLAILNSPHGRDGAAQREIEERARKSVEEGRMATLPAALERWFTPSFRRDHPEAMDLVTSWRVEADDASYAETYKVLATGVKELIAPDPPIAVPSLIITCENDSGSTPAMSEAIASEIPGAETLTVPRLRHLGVLEKPELFIEPLDKFLGNNPDSPTLRV